MAKKEPTKKKKLPPGVRERDGRYTYRYSVEVIKDGKRTRKQKETPSYPTAKEAYDAGIQIEADKMRGKLVDEKNITLGQWKKLWQEEYAIEREPRTNTLRNRSVALSSLCRYLGEYTPMKDITGHDYQRYLNQLKKDGRKKGTIQEYHRGARLFFSDAVRKKIIADDPTKDAILPAFKQTLEEIESGDTEIPKFLEKKELQHFLQVVRFRGQAQEYNIFLILAYTGLRIGELLALKISDFNEKERSLSITKTLIINSKIKEYKLGPPKNRSSVRKVIIGESVVKALKSQLAWREQKKKDFELEHDEDFFFWSTFWPGYPASCVTLDNRFYELLKLANLPTSLTPHSLRHTHVSLLAAAGVELAEIQERLGHKNDETTKQIYLHITKEKRKAVPDRFEKIMLS